METGGVSRKIDRGKHTTRHSEMIALGQDTYIVDTPGFTSLDISGITKEELGSFYREFVQYERYCKFSGCAHLSEPECGVKEAVAAGRISTERYENYKVLYRELQEVRRY